MTRVLLAWVLTAILAFTDEWKSAAPIPKGAQEVYGIAAGGKLRYALKNVAALRDSD
jgi:hypothetical protein